MSQDQVAADTNPQPKKKSNGGLWFFAFIAAGVGGYFITNFIDSANPFWRVLGPVIGVVLVFGAMQVLAGKGKS